MTPAESIGSNGKGPGVPHVHNPGYDFNDRCLSRGVAFWARLVEAWLPAGADPRGLPAKP